MVLVLAKRVDPNEMLFYVNFIFARVPIQGFLVYKGLILRPPDKNAYWKTIFFISHPKHAVGTQKNPLIETVLLSIQNTCLN